MAWSLLLRELAYLLTFVGTFVEGEVTLMTSSYMAAIGNLNIYIVFIIGVLGVLCADNFWFYIGKRYGTKLIDSHKHLKRRAQIVQNLLEKNQLFVVFLYRYAWGFRTVTPIVLGTTHISRRRFFGYTLITTPIWALIFTNIGFRLGEHLAATIAYVRTVQLAIFFAVACFIAVYFYRKYEQLVKERVRQSVVVSRKIHHRIKENVHKIKYHAKKTKSKLYKMRNHRLFKQKRLD